MPPHAVGPEFRQHVRQVCSRRIKPFACGCQTRQITKRLVMERAVEGEEKQLPPRFILERLDFGARIVKATGLSRHRNAVVRDRNPVRHRLWRVQHQLAIHRSDVDGAIIGDHHARTRRIISHDVASPKVNRGHIAIDADPFGINAGGVGAFRLPFNRDHDLSGAVIAADMGLVRPEIRQQNCRIVKPRARCQTRHIESHENIDKIHQYHRWHGISGHLAGAKPAQRVLHQVAVAGQIGSGHISFPSQFSRGNGRRSGR